MGLFSWLFRRAAPAPRDEGDAHRKRGVSHLTRGEYAEASAAFREALAARPDDPDLLRALATCSRALGDEPAAAAEAGRARELARRAADWWARFRGQPLPLLWEGEPVGHFTPGLAADYPRVKGGWASSRSPHAQRFGATLLRADYCIRPDPLRVSLGVGGEFLVTAVSLVVGPGGAHEATLLDLTVVTPPDGWEGPA